MQKLRHTLSQLGYNEIISYSFIDKNWQAILDPDVTPQELANPITADMTVMRTNLWAGLIKTLQYNQNRQQSRLRLFEMGTCFVEVNGTLQQPTRLGGVISGPVYPEQWGFPERLVDFYDVKGDIEKLLTTLLPNGMINFKPDQHPALHPGQTASVYYGEQKIGVIGLLHPIAAENLAISERLFLFEFDIVAIDALPEVLKVVEISKFPEVRRDIAFLVDEAVPANEIQDTIKAAAGDWLKECYLFDVYQGKGVPAGQKSVAIALVWQHPTKTLVDAEVTAFMEQVVTALKGNLRAELRS